MNKVTALIPTYKRPDYLYRAIKSVLKQTHGDLIVSVFDNASGDSTNEVVDNLAALDSRIKYYCHSQNIGALANFKTAFQSIDTPYFSVMSDDDILEKDFYKNAVEVLDNNHEIMFVVLNTLSVDQDLNLLSHRLNTNTLTFYCDHYRFDKWHSGDIPSTWTAMVFRKEVAEIYVRMNDKYDIASDMRFLVYAAAKYKFAYLSKTGALFTSHSDSFSSKRKKLDFVHYAVQISRYIEIVNDIDVDLYIRERAVCYLRNMLLRSSRIYRTNVFDVMKTIIKDCCESSLELKKDIAKEIDCFRFEGYLKTSVILNIFFSNRVLRSILWIIFNRHDKNIKKTRYESMSKLKHGLYKNIFEDINKYQADLL